MKLLFKILIFISLSVLFFQCENNDNSDGKNNVTDSIVAIDSSELEQKIDLSKYDRSYNDIALWLAGIEQDADGTYKNLETSEIWKNYSSDITTAFNTLQTERIVKLDSFREKELSEVNENIKTLFYPYSGPDFINANIFFPNADKIIMAALEPVGDIPDFSTFSEYQKGHYFTQIISSMRNILNQGYYVTKKMKYQYAGSVEDSISGILPIIFIFMAQSDCHILDVHKITLDSDGNVVLSLPNEIDTDDPADPYISGVQIDYFKNGENTIKTLMYFSHNIGEPKIDETPQFMTFLEQQNINVTYLKAASYLNIWFAKIRNFCLENSDYIFQDDSGIPIKYFDKNIWKIKLYGTYTTTLDMFRAYFQPQLRDAYKLDSNVIPITFSTGYNGNFEQSNLQLMIKK